jgi:RNA polymerase nonessential primary-like sigma factor
VHFDYESCLHKFTKRLFFEYNLNTPHFQQRPMADARVQLDPVKSYLREIGRFDLLTHEQEVLYGRQVQHLVTLEVKKRELAESLGRIPTLTEWAQASELSVPELQKAMAQGQRAKRKMVEANLRLVVSVAKKFTGHQVEILDLIQEGSIGLQRGVEKFDPGKGYRFSTYAYWWIKQAMMRFIAEHSRTIRLPSHVVEKLIKIRKTYREITVRMGRAATIEEIALQVDLTPAKVREYLGRSKQVLSLNAKTGDDVESEFGDLIEDPETNTEAYIERCALQGDMERLMAELNPHQQEILSLRFGLQDNHPLTLAKIGEQLAISRERVRQVEKAALDKLRRHKSQVQEYLMV